MKSTIVIIFSCFLGCTNAGNTDESASEPKHKVSSLVDTSHKSSSATDSNSLSAQLAQPTDSLNNFGWYTPDGKPVTGNPHETIGELKRRYDSSMLLYDYLVEGYRDDGAASVTFKLFTNTPVLISTEHPERIKKYIHQFGLKKYFNSWEFEFDLNRYIKKGILTDIYVIETLGRPDNKTTAANGNVTIDDYYYNDLGLMITFTNSVATSYVINH